MIALLVGLIVGFLMCIPVGPINVWVVNTFLKDNMKAALSIALGGSLMDFTYFMVVLSGLSFIHFSDQTIIILKVVGVLFLFVFGVKELFSKLEDFNFENKNNKKTKNAASFFMLGVLIYTSNPTLIATMSALAAVIKSWKLFDDHFLNYFLLSLGVALGSFGWFYFLVRIVKHYQNRIPHHYYYRFSKASGVLIVLFSFIMAFNVYKEIYL